MNHPRTLEGAQVWELVRASEGQVRTLGLAVLGFDFGAVLALGTAAGICPTAMAELLPALESVVVRKINERMGES